MLSTLYKVEINTINYHIKKIYNDNELTENSTIRNFRIVQNEGNRSVSRDVVHYNLQMIIALGFKVDNERAIQFRKWANRLDEFLKLTDTEILQDAGKISHKIACDKAESEFEKYRIIQDQIYLSDFDKYINELEKLDVSDKSE